MVYVLHDAIINSIDMGNSRDVLFFIGNGQKANVQFTAVHIFGKGAIFPYN